MLAGSVQYFTGLMYNKKHNYGSMKIDSTGKARPPL